MVAALPNQDPRPSAVVSAAHTRSGEWVSSSLRSIRSGNAMTCLLRLQPVGCYSRYSNRAVASRTGDRGGVRRTLIHNRIAIMTIEESGIDATVAHPARRYNYWLGGKDNFAADRASADEIERRFPGMRIGVRAHRDFLQHAVTYLASEVGIRQFLDIGTGLPTADNTHEVAQRVAPDARVVYVDNDPLVLAHARALLVGTPEGMTRYLHADIRDVDGLMSGAVEILDFTEPVAVLMLGVLG